MQCIRILCLSLLPSSKSRQILRIPEYTQQISDHRDFIFQNSSNPQNPNDQYCHLLHYRYLHPHPVPHPREHRRCVPSSSQSSPEFSLLLRSFQDFSRGGKLILLIFFFSVQIIITYSAIYSEVERATIIHQRSQAKQNGTYRNFHQLEHAPEILVINALVYLLNKMLLYNRFPLSQIQLLPSILVFPILFALPMDKRYRIFRIKDSALQNDWVKLRHIKSVHQVLVIVYVVYVLLSSFITEFSYGLVVAILYPFLVLQFGVLSSSLLYLSGVFTVVFGVDPLVTIPHAITMIIFFRVLLHRKYGSLYPARFSVNYFYLSLFTIVSSVWIIESQSAQYSTMIKTVRDVGCSLTFHWVITLLTIKLLREMCWEQLPKTAPNDWYMLVCFKKYMDLDRLATDHTALSNLARLQKSLSLAVCIVINVFYPLSYWILPVTVVILSVQRRVSWSRYIILLRIGILIARDIFSHFPIISAIRNPFLRNIWSMVCTHFLLPIGSQHSSYNLLMVGFKTTPYDPYSRHTVYDGHKYSFMQLLSLAVTTLLVCALIWVKIKIRRTQKIILVVAPLLFLMAVYRWKDWLQLQVYIYLMGETIRMYFSMF